MQRRRGGRQAEYENRMERDRFLVYKVESQICSVKQSLTGLHQEVMSLYILLMRSRDYSQKTYGQMLFSSEPNGVLNLLSSFTSIEEFGRLHCVIKSNKQCNGHWERN